MRGNSHDGQEVEELFEDLNGLAFGDKGYLGKNYLKIYWKEIWNWLQEKEKIWKKKIQSKNTKSNYWIKEIVLT